MNSPVEVGKIRLLEEPSGRDRHVDVHGITASLTATLAPVNMAAVVAMRIVTPRGRAMTYVCAEEC